MAVDAGSTFVSVRIRLDELKRDISKVERELKGLGSESGKQSKKFSTSWKKSFAVIGIAAGLAFAAIAKIGKSLISAASDAEETRSKFNVVFDGIGRDAQEAAKNLQESFGQSGQAAQKLLGDVGDILTGFGFAKTEALELAEQVATLGIDLASFTNFAGGAEGATAALTKALLGEAESVKALGIVIRQDTDEYKDLVASILETRNVGLVQAKALAALQIATEQSKNAIGDFARTQNEFANQMRIAKANVDDMSAALGTGLLPFANKAVTLFNKLADNLVAVSEAAIAIDKAFSTDATITDRRNALEILRKKASELREELEEIIVTQTKDPAEARALFNELSNAMERGGRSADDARKLLQGLADRLISFNGENEFGQLGLAIGDVESSVLALERALNSQIKTLGDLPLEAEKAVLLAEEVARLEAERLKAIEKQKELDAIRLNALEELAAAEKENAEFITELRGETALALANGIALRLQQEEEATEKQLDNLQKIKNATNSVYGSLTNTIGSFFDFAISRAEKDSEKQKRLKKTQFNINKLFSAANAGIAGAEGAVQANKALAGIPIIGPALGIAAAVALGTFTAAQVAFILAQKPPSFAGGGVATPSSGGTNAIVAENGSAELLLNAGSQGEALLNEFAARVAEAGGGGAMRIEIPLIVDGIEMARSVVDNINRRETPVNGSSVVDSR